MHTETKALEPKRDILVCNEHTTVFSPHTEVLCSEFSDTFKPMSISAAVKSVLNLRYMQIFHTHTHTHTQLH